MGPENIILSVLKIFGALVILCNINGWLTLAAFIVLPFMFWFALVLNKRMRGAFKRNREKIASINEQIEDNLSGIRVVKSFANEDIENKKFIQMCISKIEEKQSRKLNAEEIRLIKTVAPIMRLTATDDEN